MCIGKTKYTTPCYLVLSGGIVNSVSLYFFCPLSNHKVGEFLLFKLNLFFLTAKIVGNCWL